MSYDTRWTISWADPHFPQIVRMANYDSGRVGMLRDDEEGMTWGMCQVVLLKELRKRRDHWASVFRAIRDSSEPGYDCPSRDPGSNRPDVNHGG